MSLRLEADARQAITMSSPRTSPSSIIRYRKAAVHMEEETSRLQMTPQDLSPTECPALTKTKPWKQKSGSVTPVQDSLEVSCHSGGAGKKDKDEVSFDSGDTLRSTMLSPITNISGQELTISLKESKGLGADCPGRDVSMNRLGIPVMEEGHKVKEEEEKEESIARTQQRDRCLVSQPRTDTDTGDNDVVDLRKAPNLAKVALSDSTGSLLDVDSSSSNCSDEEASCATKGSRRAEEHGPLSEALDTGSRGDGFEGLVFGTQEELEKFLTNLRERPRDSGICVWNGMAPVWRQGVQRYEEDEEFRKVRTLKQPSKHSPFGVFLCQDTQTEQRFIIKKIEATNHRLAGLEFMVKHSGDSYLPQIYAVYKEKGVVWIFEEYIPQPLTSCCWTLEEICEFSCCLLSALRNMHREGLAHCDLKPANVMVRDRHRPDSLVLIDFESAKHRDPKFHFHSGGHTLSYLPPWHQRILQLDTFDPQLMMADFWAVACILILLIRAAVSEDLPFQGHAVWVEIMAEILEGCPTCCDYDGRFMCSSCRRRFLTFLENRGHEILHIHLEDLMTEGSDDPHWPPLRRLLESLTDPANVDCKNVDAALRSLQF